MRCISLLLVVAAFGAGCTGLSGVRLPSLPNINLDTVDWKTYQNTTYGFSIKSPSPGFTPGIPELTDDVAVISIGSAVHAPPAVSVPETALHIKVVKKDSPLLKKGCYAEQGWDDPSVLPDKPVSAAGRTFCLHAEQDAAAGNRYNSYTYALPLDGNIVVFSFVVHSLVCENFERPSEQCVAFDEGRDTASFQSILETFSTSTATP